MNTFQSMMVSADARPSFNPSIGSDCCRCYVRNGLLPLHTAAVALRPKLFAMQVHAVRFIPVSYRVIGLYRLYVAVYVRYVQ